MTLDIRGKADQMIAQYRGTSAQGLLQRVLDMMQSEVVDPVNALSAEYDDLVGWQLDELGARMGFSRPRIEDDTLVYFGFADQDVNFNRGVLATSDEFHFPGIPINDVSYRRMLRARGIALRSDGSRESVIASLSHLSANGTARVEERRPTQQHLLSAMKGMTVFATSSHQAIIGITHDGRLIHVDHVTGFQRYLHGGTRVTFGGQALSSDDVSGIGVNGRRLRVTGTLDSNNIFVYQSGTNVGRDVEATSESWTGGSSSFVDAGAGNLTGHLGVQGETFYIAVQDNRPVMLRDLGSLNYEIFILQTSGRLQHNGDNIATVLGMTHDYHGGIAKWGRLVPGSTIYVGTQDGKIYSTPVGLTDEGGDFADDASDTWNFSGGHVAVELVADVAQELDQTSSIQSLAYHDGDFYMSLEPQNTLAVLPADRTNVGFSAHIYHPNAHYRTAVANNIDALIGKPAGVKLTLHTHSEP